MYKKPVSSSQEILELMDYLYGLSLKEIQEKLTLQMLPAYAVIADVHHLSVEYSQLTYSQMLCLFRDDKAYADYSGLRSMEECKVFRCQGASAPLLNMQHNDLKCSCFMDTPITEIYHAMNGIADPRHQGTLRNQYNEIRTRVHDSLGITLTNDTSYRMVISAACHNLYDCSIMYKAREACEILEILCFELNRMYLECRCGKTEKEVISQVSAKAKEPQDIIKSMLYDDDELPFD